jgi:hypothetical protein
MTTVLLALALVPQDMPKDYADALAHLGKTGDYAGGVFKVSLPRNDLTIRVDRVELPTSFGFSGWIAMTKGEGGKDVMMGDLVLLQEEVNPVMSALFANGLEVTALHNHFFYENPRVYFMHVHGMGLAVDLAKKIKPAIDLMGNVPLKGILSTSIFASEIEQGTFATADLDKIVGAKGSALSGGVYKYTIGRPDIDLREMGARIETRMGLNSWASFFGSDAMAVVAGDVAMLAGELTPVMKALRTHGIEVVAIHNHMAGSSPSVYFLHYWGRGKAADLARGFKAALDATGKPGHRMSR